jgi:DNA-binding transcriptional LysR family regulator
MELRRLEHFVAVAEEQNFTRAAQRLHIVQSGVSASVRALERELGMALFARTTQRVELTEAGRLLLPDARRILTDVATARQRIDELRGGLRGRLDLGILYGFTSVSVAELLAEFRDGHPQVELRLPGPGVQGTAHHARELREGRLDLAFLMVTGPQEGLVSHWLSTESVLLACPPDHPSAASETVGLESLGGETFIDTPPGYGVRAAVDRSFAAAGIERHPTFEMGDISTVLDLVRHRLGIAFVPEYLTGQAPDLCYLRIREHPPTFDVVLAASADRPLTPVAGAFLTTVLNCRGELIGKGA